MAVATELRDQTAAFIGGFRGHIELRTTALGTWYLAQGTGRQTVGMLVLDGQCDIDGLALLTWRLKQLDLPGIASIHDLLASSGRHWLIISSAPGPTVSDLTRAGRRDPDSVVAVVRDTGSTLLEMHSRGLVHGNVGAGSVIVDDQGGARLLDWFGPGPAHTAADDVRQWARLVWSLACGWCAQDFTLGVGLARAAGAAIGSGGLLSALDELNRLVAEPPRGWLAESAARWLSTRCASVDADVDPPTDRFPTAGSAAISEHVSLVRVGCGEQRLPSRRRYACGQDEADEATGFEPALPTVRSLLVAPHGQIDSGSEHLAGQSADSAGPAGSADDSAGGSVGPVGPAGPAGWLSGDSVEPPSGDPADRLSGDSVEPPSGDPADRLSDDSVEPAGPADDPAHASEGSADHTDGPMGDRQPERSESPEYGLRWRDDQDLARLTARAALGWRRRDRRRRRLLWALGAVGVIASVAAVMLTVGGPSTMHVRSISVQLEPTGTACAVLGTVITNGLPGTLAYRWTDGVTQPGLLQTTTTSAGQYSVRLAAPDTNARPAGTVVALELLQPDPRRAFVQLGSDCY